MADISILFLIQFLFHKTCHSLVLCYIQCKSFLVNMFVLLLYLVVFLFLLYRATCTNKSNVLSFALKSPVFKLLSAAITPTNVTFGKW